MSEKSGIKVGIRCRPFTQASKLGVHMVQTSGELGCEAGEVRLLGSEYTTSRFAFDWAWWTAHGYERFVQPDSEGGEALCADMPITTQEDVYAACGVHVKNDLVNGMSIVLLAYGLSGSGKTYTVFGPDTPDDPNAWFKQASPHPAWGLFPRLAYELCLEKQDGWTLRMKAPICTPDVIRSTGRAWPHSSTLSGLPCSISRTWWTRCATCCLRSPPSRHTHHCADA